MVNVLLSGLDIDVCFLVILVIQVGVLVGRFFGRLVFGKVV